MKKVRKFKLYKYLPHTIFERPSDTEKISFEYGTIRADDQFYINDLKYGLWYIYLYLAAGCFFISIIGLTSDKDPIFFTIISFLIGCFCILYYYKHPKKLLILDRLNGLVTYPGFLYSKPYTMSFSDVVAKIVSSGGRASLVFYHYNGITGTSISAGDYIPIRNWSFIVWYMDKNRNLPPGEAFDPYREKDFHRRKAEGFPPPLYKSNIPTGDSIVFTEDFTKNKNSQENNAISKKNSIKKRKKK
ncbi:hypothetical protein [Capnocytophaga sputigena]|uniref:hypothetical protein n=2 Tax=Capnocytophaga sputigena TaxID=1019 RepID=UPI0028D74BF3|nr:hypothetical protein [Capnocytophaga sputigena]